MLVFSVHICYVYVISRSICVHAFRVYDEIYISYMCVHLYYVIMTYMGNVFALQKTKKYDAFITHDWGFVNGRSNHARVLQLAEALRKRGVTFWVDEEQMTGLYIFTLTLARALTLLGYMCFSLLTHRHIDIVRFSLPPIPSPPYTLCLHSPVIPLSTPISLAHVLSMHVHICMYIYPSSYTQETL